MGHSKYKNKWDWRSEKSQPVLQKFRTQVFSQVCLIMIILRIPCKNRFQASQVVANIRPGSKDVEPAYYLVKGLF